MVAVAASATSNQQAGFYPRPNQQQQAYGPPPAQGSGAPQGYDEPVPQQPYAQAEPEPAPEPVPAPAPEPEPVQAQPAPPAEEPVAANAPAEKRTQWFCTATGWWQKCETNSYACYSQMTTMSGFGSTEPLARSSAESMCNTSMSRLMSVNFTYRTSVTQRCKALKCSPPNAR